MAGIDFGEFRTHLVEEAHRRIDCRDPSHDIWHSLRVSSNAEQISRVEGGDLEVILPAALFHDSVVYQKKGPKSKDSARESSEVAKQVLRDFGGYSKRKIRYVVEAILEHPYEKGIRPERLESKIVQDADRLEATGVIGIMRTFSSSGQMGRSFYHAMDPFCFNREHESSKYAVDLFYERLLKVRDSMNTEHAKKLAEYRGEFLHLFLDQLKREIG